MVKVGAIVMMWIAMNLAAGLTSYMFTDTNGEFIFLGSNVITGDINTVNGSLTVMQGIVQPSNVAENKGNLFYRIMDMINLGMITRLGNFIKTMAFGMSDAVVTFFKSDMCNPGQIVCDAQTNFVWTVYTINIVMYVIGLFLLWTGRNVTE